MLVAGESGQDASSGIDSWGGVRDPGDVIKSILFVSASVRLCPETMRDIFGSQPVFFVG